MQNAMIIDSRDNVIVAIEPIAKGDTVTWMCDGKENTLRFRILQFTTRLPVAIL